MITGLDHLQIALPACATDGMRTFYCGLLGLTEVPKPAPLKGRGGFWAVAGTTGVHFGIDPDFTPQTKGHPAFLVRDIHALAERLQAAGIELTWDSALPDVTRCFVADPVGNRVELIADD